MSVIVTVACCASCHIKLWFSDRQVKKEPHTKGWRLQRGSSVCACLWASFYYTVAVKRCASVG